MGIVEICISFQVAIMGIAYPIILQVVTDLDNKYSSGLITELFESESNWRGFRIALMSSLVSTFLYIVKNIINVWWDLGVHYTYLLGFLIIGSSFALVVAFLIFMRKIMRYYSPEKITQYFIKQDSEDA